MFVLVLLDGILIYSMNEEEHVEHLRLTLKLLGKHKLYAGLSKCDFFKDRTHYLGHIILDKGIYVDLEKIEAMRCCPAPRKLTNVKYFVALAGYYRRFTEEYFARKIESLYGMTKPTGEVVVPWPFLKTAGRMT